jgi:hypothetical protein
LEQYPRFATKFVHNVRQLIEPQLLGKSTITWWEEIASKYGDI